MQISSKFLYEIFKLCFKNRQFFELCKKYLKYEFLPSEGYKEIWKKIINYTNLNNDLPSIGGINQSLLGLKDTNLQNEIEKILSEIKNTPTPNLDTIISELENYLKISMSSSFLSKAVKSWNDNEQEKVLKSILKFSNELQNFRLKDDIEYDRIIKDFDKRLNLRRIDYELGAHFKNKAYFGIDQLDEIAGGVEETELVGFLAQSGIGKSTLIRWIGFNNAMLGLDVLHFQLEGSKKDAELGYEQLWTGINKYKLANSLISEEEYNNLDFSKSTIKGEVHLKAFEQFGTVTTLDVRNGIIDFEKKNGKKPELVLIDYFELLEPGLKINQRFDNGAFGEKKRRIAIAQELKNIAMEQKVIIIIVTQASAVEDKLLNDDTFVMTRYNCSGDKNMVNPFSYFFTLNQTDEEYYQQIMRIWVDKLRHSKKGRNREDRIVKIIQDYDHSKFYNRSRTMVEILSRWDAKMVQELNK